MNAKRTYKVKALATMAGISIRTLHYYDEIGLLAPSARTDAGYRLYTDDDLLRLQQILIGRALGLPLADIQRSLDEPDFDRREALCAQREALARRARETQKMIRAIDRAIATIDGADPMENADMKAIFDGFDPAEHDTEAQERWGDTDAYKISAQRTRGYGETEWKTLKAEQDGIYAAAFAALESGASPSDVEAMDIAERHRLSIDRWFYPCSKQMHRNLADLYEADPRFAKNIDKHGAGLTPFLSAAIRANSDRA